MNTTIRIGSLQARQILDSRGWPTIEVRLEGEAGPATASAPAGASTGEHEAVELRDGGTSFAGRGVTRAVELANTEVAELLTGRTWSSQRELDEALAALDGSGAYRRIGANTAVAASIAASRLFADAAGLPLHTWIARSTSRQPALPVPHFNVINGGAHAANALDFQEFMIAPVGARTIDEAIEAGAAVYHTLAALIRRQYGSAGIGDEGGFAPPIADPREALDLLQDAIEESGHRADLSDVAIALDPAANGFYAGGGHYRFDGQEFDRESLVRFYDELVAEYPIRSIEDGFAEDDIEGWQQLSSALGSKIELVGDDLYVTDAQRIADGAGRGLSNAALIKPNQIGTVTQTLDAIATAQQHGMRCMVSHRSGETLDTFIADLAVGAATGRIKAGAPARGERIAKYNRLSAIAGDHADLTYGLDSEP